MAFVSISRRAKTKDRDLNDLFVVSAYGKYWFDKWFDGSSGCQKRDKNLKKTVNRGSISLQ